MGLMLHCIGLMILGVIAKVNALAISANPNSDEISKTVKEPSLLKVSNGLAPDGGTTANQKKIKVPQYMLDLFSAVTDNKTGKRRKNDSLPGNIVRSFYSQVLPANDKFPADLVFNITNIPNTEIIRKCELQIYRRSSKYSSKAKGNQPNFRTIKVMTDVGKTIDYELLSSRRFGWVQFDVTSAVKYAMGPIMRIRDTLLKLSVVQIQRMEEDQLEFALSKRDTKEPILVVYSDEKLPSNAIVTKSNRSNGLLEEYQFNQIKNNRVKKRVKRSEGKSGCYREDMIVDIQKIGWDGFILQPPVFNIYRCSGACQDLAASLEGTRTNHAVIQAYMSVLGRGENTQAPCCSPIKLESQHFLVIEKRHPQVIVKLKSFTDVIVRSCGCL